MARRMDRREFLRAFGASTAVLIGVACAPQGGGAPTAAPSRPAASAASGGSGPAPATAAAPAPSAGAGQGQAPPAAAKAVGQGDKLVVALGQWGTEAPFAWMSAAA